MNFKKKLLISLGVVMLAAYTFANTNKDPYEKALAEYDRLSAKYINDMCQKHNLHPFGDGGSFLENINDLFYCFKTLDDLTYEEYREKMIAISSELLQRVNANKKIRPHLVQFPFDENGLSLQIISTSKLMQKREDIVMKIVILSKGKISLQTKKTSEDSFKKTKQETFAEALKKCHMTHPNSELLTENANPNNKQNI